VSSYQPNGHKPLLDPPLKSAVKCYQAVRGSGGHTSILTVLSLDLAASHLSSWGQFSRQQPGLRTCWTGSFRRSSMPFLQDTSPLQAPYTLPAMSWAPNYAGVSQTTKSMSQSVLRDGQVGQ
jgi:hypothetical protein